MTNGSNNINYSLEHNTETSTFFIIEADCNCDNNEEIVSASVHGNWEILQDSLKQNFQNHIYEICAQIIADHADYKIDYFGFKTLERSYLLKLNG